MYPLGTAGTQREVVFWALLGRDIAVVKSSYKRTVLPSVVIKAITVVTIRGIRQLVVDALRSVNDQSLLFKKRFRRRTQFILGILHQTVVFDTQRCGSDNAELLGRWERILHDRNDAKCGELIVGLSAVVQLMKQ